MQLNIQKPLAIVGVVIGAIVSLSLLAALMPNLFSSVSSITDNVTTGDVGNDQANAILHVFGFIVPIVLILGIVGLVFAAVQFTKK